MSYTAIRGGTVYGVSGFSDHLIILCSEPMFYRVTGTKAILSVNVSSWYEYSPSNDDSCILNVGDHDFIKHKSFCLYQRAVPLNVLKLEDRVVKGEMKDYGMLKPEVLERVIAGFRKSPVLSREAANFIQLMEKNGLKL